VSISVLANWRDALRANLEAGNVLNPDGGAV